MLIKAGIKTIDEVTDLEMKVRVQALLDVSGIYIYTKLWYY
jgi:hypothetical protein